MTRKPTHSSLSDHALELIAARFKVLSEPMRLKLIIALEAGELNVTQLVKATRGTQTNISRHLQSLTEAGILGRRKEGLRVYYRIADDSIYAMCEHVCGSLEKRLDAHTKALRR